ncbi:glycoside hydrolase family 72 protein [Bombardia bombarda]|uniref:1,3-beta-glucanosyltransferase n=1 Tax=Bombardia bombarda TaxID=252184 RepID=A0AA39X9T4_9PEZI|nr:glycoside hydrolase family 72 protein [Bombardia bombarda]
MGFIKAALTTALLGSHQAMATLQPITMKGAKFFYENGTQFYMKGVAYQQEVGAAGEVTSQKYLDPLADTKNCAKDIPLLAELKTNTIRTYAIDPTADHDECMALLDKAGIYVIADLGEPAKSINRDDPVWDIDLFKRYTDVIDALSPYSNVIGFFAGNEVSNNASNTPASAFVKAAVRDTKAYIAKKQEDGGRWMGVGYAANDDPNIRVPSAHYFNCGEEKEAIDFWGYNIYSWCGTSSFEKSGFDKQTEFFRNYSVPVFFAEYGCNVGDSPPGAEGRLWEDTLALYSDKMTDVWSGGIVYMYHQEENDYGLVKVGSGAPEKLDNFGVLKTQIAKVDPTQTSIEDYQPTNSAQACPAISEDWQVAGNALPPTPDSSLCECMFSSLSCVPASSLAIKSYGSIFGFICENSPESCDGIKADTAAGVYGPYGGCTGEQKLGYVMNEYYKNLDEAADACDFEGQADIVKAPSVASTCTAALSSASAAAANAGTATGASSSSTSSSGATKSSNPAVPGARMERMMSVGDFAVGLYLLVAMGAGGAMVLL